MKDRSRYFIRLALAGQAFREADAIAEHILGSQIEPGNALYHACVAGLVTSYCRPFMSASGLGPLPADFRSFADADKSMHLQTAHDAMLTARDKISAHFDLEYGEGEFHKKHYALHPGEVELVLSRKDFFIRSNHTTMSVDAVARSRVLFAFQLKRLVDAQSAFAISIVKETRGRLGSYVFSPAKKA